jgi:hypothetical protein
VEAHHRTAIPVDQPSVSCLKVNCSSNSKARHRAWCGQGRRSGNPGGDVIHYSDANNRDDVELRFLVTMMCVPGQPMLTLVSEQELATRKHLRLPAQPGPESFDGEQ